MISPERGVAYFGHIPHGFDEKGMREYLSQFGEITNLRLGRSSKTGGSKGYAFVEFKFKGVANVMAETMNNYLMFEKILKCQVIPSEHVKKSIFKGKINPKKSPAKMRRFAAKKAINASKTEEQNEKRTKRHANKLQKIKEKLNNFGVVLNVNAK